VAIRGAVFGGWRTASQDRMDQRYRDMIAAMVN
jgi:hypothetical protein